MKATLKGKYESSNNSVAATLTVDTQIGDVNLKASTTNFIVGNKSPTASLSVDTKLGDIKLKGSATDFIIADGPSLPSSLSFSLGKPGSFSIDYFPKKDIKFQFMNSVKVLEKEVQLTYTHEQRKNRTAVEGTVKVDAGNKIAVSNVLGTEEWMVRYTYAHGALRRTVIEPCYDVKANDWDFAVTRKFERGDVVKATCRPSKRALDLEWTGDIPGNTTIKFTEIKMSKKLKGVHDYWDLYDFWIYRYEEKWSSKTYG